MVDNLLDVLLTDISTLTRHLLVRNKDDNSEKKTYGIMGNTRDDLHLKTARALSGFWY